MRVVPPENDTVEATWVAAWAYFSWVRIAQLALRRGPLLEAAHVRAVVDSAAGQRARDR